MHVIKNKTELPIKVTVPTEPFPAFHASNATQYDEGVNRGYTLGKNPSVEKDFLGNTNVACREVLYRWATKKDKEGIRKARYVGIKTNKEEWIDDWKNWEVRVRKTNEDDREWVKLGTPKAIQMGHKLSAVSYWVYGYDPLKNTILKGFF